MAEPSKESWPAEDPIIKPEKIPSQHAHNWYPETCRGQRGKAAQLAQKLVIVANLKILRWPKCPISQKSRVLFRFGFKMISAFEDHSNK